MILFCSQMAPKHKFVDMKITAEANSNELQTILAHFRACGGRISPNHTLQPTQSHPTQQQQPAICDESNIDVLDPGNHQHLSVLFCSYSTFSQNAPSFCVNPWYGCVMVV